MTKPTKWLCTQRRLRSAWASAQSDQSLHCQHGESLGPYLPIEHTAKTLIRLGGCPGWSESSLGTHSFCWFCHVVAQMLLTGTIHVVSDQSSLRSQSTLLAQMYLFVRKVSSITVYHIHPNEHPRHLKKVKRGSYVDSATSMWIQQLPRGFSNYHMDSAEL